MKTPENTAFQCVFGSIGMVSTAHEQFKKLRMWPEAVECLIVAERNVEAEDMLKAGLGRPDVDRRFLRKASNMSENGAVFGSIGSRTCFRRAF